jgi:hypothetical protein
MEKWRLTFTSFREDKKSLVKETFREGKSLMSIGMVSCRD